MRIHPCSWKINQQTNKQRQKRNLCRSLTLWYFMCFVYFFLPRAILFVSWFLLVCFLVYFILFVSSSFVPTSASDCLDRLVSEMAYYVSSGTSTLQYSFILYTLNNYQIQSAHGIYKSLDVVMFYHTCFNLANLCRF